MSSDQLEWLQGVYIPTMPCIWGLYKSNPSSDLHSKLASSAVNGATVHSEMSVGEVDGIGCS